VGLQNAYRRDQFQPCAYGSLCVVFVCLRIAEIKPSRAVDKIGAFAGVSGRTVEKIATIVDAAEVEPEKYGRLKEEMDRTGRVDNAFKQLKRVERHKQIAENSKFCAKAKVKEGQFALIYADPPWSFDTYSEKGKDMTSPDNHYPTLSYEEIANIEVDGYCVSEIAAKDAVCLMWCTSANFLLAAEVMKAWGFTYKTHFSWDKQRTGTGYWCLNQHEVLLLGTRE
jgi:hypothetical protein